MKLVEIDSIENAKIETNDEKHFEYLRDNKLLIDRWQILAKRVSVCLSGHWRLFMVKFRDLFMHLNGWTMVWTFDAFVHFNAI